ncbi:cysteine hydrolase [Pendulispora brunnea]|uniref:Cysteine hydrolase n=1 Tax=Pendulispora brunnea TaxID=2905690 RepID=A0ABZ2KAI0_9BACT
MHEASGLSIPRSLEDVCNPREMALLVYDMQVGIVRQVKNSKEIVAGVGHVLEAARQVNMRIFYTRHLSLPRELMGSFQYRMAMTWQRVEKPELVKPWFLRDSPAFPIVPELSPRPSEAIFDKLAMSAFEGTPLTMALRDCGIRAVAIVGVALEVGIEPTARHACDLGLIPVIVRDACGFGHEDAAQRSVASLTFGGDSIFTDIATFRQKLGLAN